MTAHHLEPGLGLGADRDRPLRLSVQLDAVASGALGLLASVAAPVLDDFLGIPAALLLTLGLLLVAWAAALWLIATRTRVAPRAVWAVIVINLLWVVGSVAVVAAGSLSPTTAGLALVLVQAATVVLISDLQFLALRRARRPAGA